MQANTMFDVLTTLLIGPMSGAIAARLGVDEATVKKAITVAVPVLIAALARNASSKRGAASLSGALARDHDGSLLDDVGGYVATGDTVDGAAILKHVLGRKRTKAAAGISEASGLDPQRTSQLMAMLAPLVMAYLGKQQRENELKPGDLGDLLAKEEASVEQNQADVLGGVLGGLLGGSAGSGAKGAMSDAVASIGAGMLRQWLESGQRRSSRKP